VQIDFILSSSLWVHFSLISKFTFSVSLWVLRSVPWVCILLQNQKILKTFNLQCHLKNLEMHHMNSQGSSQLEIGKSHHFFFYNILCGSQCHDIKMIIFFSSLIVARGRETNSVRTQSWLVRKQSKFLFQNQNSDFIFLNILEISMCLYYSKLFS
jgi:hypothetical protein